METFSLAHTASADGHVLELWSLNPDNGWYFDAAFAFLYVVLRIRGLGSPWMPTYTYCYPQEKMRKLNPITGVLGGSHATKMVWLKSDYPVHAGH